MSENDDIIETESGIIIRGYSTNSEKETQLNTKYSLIDLGDCEDKIKEYYNLDENTELYILGIDSPNKDTSASTSVYNYGVYLENGTLLDHTIACKDTKISISSAIANTDLVKLEQASYFDDLGYDIYNETSEFYTDYCASASIDGNDITLSDRKKDFYPSNVSLCNDSCHYSNVDLETKRFTCECDTGYNFSDNYDNEEEENEDDTSYLDYFLSLINYKIAVCYDLFFDYKSYYYNAGFYISVGTFVFCLGDMFVFINMGMMAINKIIKDNIPSKGKLKESLKELNEKKKKYIELKNDKSNPLKKNDSERNLNSKNKIIKRKSKKKNNNLFKNEENIKIKNIINFKDIKQNNKKNNKSSNRIIVKKDKINLNTKRYKNKNLLIETETKRSLKYKNKIIINKYKSNKRRIVKDEFGLIQYISDEQVNKKELNKIPYTQALRIYKRSYIEMFLSMLANEIDIISIFYYKNPYNHLSLVLSIYVFELCLDLTLNCLLYTDDVVSEKYNNNGSIEFFTSLSLSFMSNIFASIIAFIVGKFANYDEILELIVKSITKQKEYFILIIKFKKYLTLKLTAFFIVQGIINLGMCYYLMIFCTIYHNTQGSIMVNYIVGIAESLLISLGLSIIISLIRYLSLKKKWKSIYYTSKYIFEKF